MLSKRERRYNSPKRDWTAPRTDLSCNLSCNWTSRFKLQIKQNSSDNKSKTSSLHYLPSITMITRNDTSKVILAFNDSLYGVSLIKNKGEHLYVCFACQTWDNLVCGLTTPSPSRFIAHSKFTKNYLQKKFTVSSVDFLSTYIV